MKPATDRRRAAEVRSRCRECLAAFAWVGKFYRVIGPRIIAPAGEIDPVALAPAGRLCFIEVTARHNQEHAAEALSGRQSIESNVRQSFICAPDRRCATKPSDLALC